MHVITEKRIREAKAKWPNTATALDYWYQLAKGSRPSDFAAMKAIFPAVDKVGELHVFDIGGNKLRLIALSGIDRKSFISSMCWITANMIAENGRRKEHECSDQKSGRALGVCFAGAAQTKKRRRL